MVELCYLWACKNDFEGQLEQKEIKAYSYKALFFCFVIPMFKIFFKSYFWPVAKLKFIQLLFFLNIFLKDSVHYKFVWIRTLLNALSNISGTLLLVSFILKRQCPLAIALDASDLATARTLTVFKSYLAVR